MHFHLIFFFLWKNIGPWISSFISGILRFIYVSQFLKEKEREKLIVFAAQFHKTTLKWSKMSCFQNKNKNKTKKCLSLYRILVSLVGWHKENNLIRKRN